MPMCPGFQGGETVKDVTNSENCSNRRSCEGFFQFVPCSSPDDQNSFIQESDSGYSEVGNSEQNMLQLSIIPVSYTHLDVYKRQHTQLPHTLRALIFLKDNNNIVLV